MSIEKKVVLGFAVVIVMVVVMSLFLILSLKSVKKANFKTLSMSGENLKSVENLQKFHDFDNKIRRSIEFLNMVMFIKDTDTLDKTKKDFDSSMEEIINDVDLFERSSHTQEATSVSKNLLRISKAASYIFANQLTILTGTNKLETLLPQLKQIRDDYDKMVWKRQKLLKLGPKISDVAIAMQKVISEGGEATSVDLTPLTIADIEMLLDVRMFPSLKSVVGNISRMEVLARDIMLKVEITSIRRDMDNEIENIERKLMSSKINSVEFSFIKELLKEYGRKVDKYMSFKKEIGALYSELSTAEGVIQDKQNEIGKARESSSKLFANEINPTIKEIKAMTGDSITQALNTVEENAHLTDASASRSNKTVEKVTLRFIVLLLIIIGLSIFSSYTTSRGLGSSVQKLLDKAKIIATGDFKSGLTDQAVMLKRKDEIGKMVKALNEIVTSIGMLIKETKVFMTEVMKMGENIDSVTGEIQEKAHSVHSAVEIAKGSVDSIVSAIEQTDAGVEEIASGSQETAKNAQEADEQMSRMNELQQEGKKNLTEAVQKIANIKNMTEKTVEAVNKLQSSSQEIGAIVSTINSIAEQTNLLALNAAIEAARAGEAGKGFAVVAEEIRNLAEETKKATANIGELIEGIQENTENTIKVVKDTTKAVEIGEKVMNRVTEGLGQILEAVSKTSGMIQNIASMAEEQSASTEEMATAIDHVSKSANEITDKMNSVESEVKEMLDSMGELMSTSKELTEELEKLDISLNKFMV